MGIGCCLGFYAIWSFDCFWDVVDGLVNCDFAVSIVFVGLDDVAFGPWFECCLLCNCGFVVFVSSVFQDVCLLWLLLFVGWVFRLRWLWLLWYLWVIIVWLFAVVVWVFVVCG